MNIPSIGNTASITCGCDMNIRFRGMNPKLFKINDVFEIIDVYGVHSNTCDSSYIDQCELIRERSSDYKKYTYQVLLDIMI